MREAFLVSQKQNAPAASEQSDIRRGIFSGERSPIIWFLQNHCEPASLLSASSWWDASSRKTVPPQATVKIARKLRIFPVFPEDSSSVSSAGSAAEVVVCAAGSAAQVSAFPETARIQRLKKLQSRSLQRMRLRFPMAISPAATAKWVRTKRLRCDPDRRHS